MKSTFYYGGSCVKIASEIRDYINKTPALLSPSTADSTRAVGDALEVLIADKFGDFLGSWCAEYSSDFARRAMADLAFTDKEGFYSVVDVKTHREDTKFNMPNVTSVERLTRFYESDQNIFALIMVKYAIEGTKVIATEVTYSPIEFLDWNCLTIGALGWGQIQISNSNIINLRDGYSRKSWMLELCETMLEFYPKEISKIKDRMDRFDEIKAHWEAKEDIWN